MTVFPIVAVSRPADLATVTNGQLDPAILRPVGPRGQLHHTAARAWLALTAAALDAGHPLTYTYGGCYRTYAEQEALFRQRYTPTPLEGRPYKLWNGVHWYQRPGVAMAAVPGTSNHGWGLAVDTATGDDPSRALPISTQALGWLLDHAARFGWSWELQSEPWHIRYVTGDRIPAAVTDRERIPEPQPSPTPPEDDPVKYLALESETKGGALLAFSDRGCTMVGFASPADRDRLVKAYTAAVVPVTDAQYDAFVAATRT